MNIINDKKLNKFYDFYELVKSECEESLNKINKSFFKKDDNKIVQDALDELIRMNSDGKFLRASLIALGYMSFSNKKDNKYIPLATAYETFQTSILIHDDIIDNADLRRGKKTIPKSYLDKFENEGNESLKFKKDSFHISNSLGICIGDLGFYLASKIVIDNYSNMKCFNNILELYNKIVINTIKGEIIDVLLPFNEQYKIENHSTTIDDVMEIYNLKTAWYSIIGPYLLGMSLTNVDKSKMMKMQEVLYNLGVAFQIKDDILGVFGDASTIGKSSTSDISEFKQTLLYAYLVKNNSFYHEKLLNYYGNSNLSKNEIEEVKNIFVESGSYDYSINVMEDLFNKSKNMLEEIDFIKPKYKDILLGFITYLDIRTK